MIEEGMFLAVFCRNDALYCLCFEIVDHNNQGTDRVFTICNY